MKIIDLDQSWLNQVNYKQHYFPLKEIVLAHFQSLFGRSNHDAFLENEGKTHEQHILENSWNLLKTTIIVIILKSSQDKTYNEYEARKNTS